MDYFTEAQKSELISRGGKKEIYFLKTTESFHRSILDCQKNPDCSNPKIQFDPDSKTICISTVKGIEQYSFNKSCMVGNGKENVNNHAVSLIQENEDGSNHTLGRITEKIQIQAREESFHNTILKMTAAEKVQKQYCTKEIKPSGAFDRVNHFKKLSKPVHFPGQTKDNVGDSFNSLTVLSNKQNIIPSTKHVTSSSANFPAIPLNRNRINSAISSYNPSGKITRGSSSSVTDKACASKEPSAIQFRPLRERIVHILAVDPCTFIEIRRKLLIAMNKEDSTNYKNVLKEVAVIIDGKYHLSNASWKEVQHDWKFYSQADKEVVHRKIQLRFQEKEKPDIQKKSSNDNIANIYPTNRKRRISRVNGESTPEIWPLGSVQALNEKATSYKNDSNTRCFISSARSKKSIDDHSSSTQSSGYVSESSSSRPDDNFNTQLKKDAACYSKSMLDMKNGLKRTRTEDSELNSQVTSFSQISDQLVSLGKDCGFKRARTEVSKPNSEVPFGAGNNEQISHASKGSLKLNQKASNLSLRQGNKEPEKNDSISFDVDCEMEIDNLGSSKDFSNTDLKNAPESFPEKEVSLKIVLVRSPKHGFKIKQDKPLKKKNKDFKKKYVTIVSQKQKNRYQTYYEAKFELNNKRRQKLNQLWNKISDLEKQLKENQKGKYEYQIPAV